MKIEFIDTNLHEIDEVEVQAMIVSAFREERPFFGMAGLVDWRMCSEFSRLALDKFVTSELGEAVMVPAYNRLRADSVILLGLGQGKNFGPDEVRLLGTRISEIIRGLHLSTLLIDLPGSPHSTLSPGKRMQFLLESMKKNGVLSSGNIRMLIAEKAGYHSKLQSVARRMNPRSMGNIYG